jgi:stage III sporulation protein AA|tara:strand:+ start:2189 stop:3190 length:1002 start_codon:yes stop_codon:yes gene_type:complete
MITLNEDLRLLLNIFPDFTKTSLLEHSNLPELTEIIFDIGKNPKARFIHGSEILSTKIISKQDIAFCLSKINQFNNKNRAGIKRTLHRISCLKNREDQIIGLTCRVGRSMFGLTNKIRDLLIMDKSILILGRPGVGKTTVIRELTRILANEMRKRVVIVDTSNEIAGNNNVPHVAVGQARRLQVKNSHLQHQILIEAIENHMPEVIVIDEIGTESEGFSARTIAERGVQLIGTAHGNKLENLVRNPTLMDLIGGVQSVTLSDQEAKNRNSKKSILERKFSPTFHLIIEINSLQSWTIYENVTESVDLLLKSAIPRSQTRTISDKDKLTIISNS